MSDKTGIQWTDSTWNPTTGCTKVSPGCAHCYIERTPAFRINGRRFVRGATDLRLHDDRLDQPLRWRKPRRVFVNSLSDLFHHDVPDAFIGRVFGVMAAAHWHQFQLLTKRAARLREWSRGVAHYPRGDRWLRPEPGWPPNVWVGVSVENQRFADERIPLLLETPARVRFISAEPLLQRVDISPYLHGLDWVIVGGESGHCARPFDVWWARSIVTQCRIAKVPVFVKQLGTKPEIAQTCGDCDPCLAGQRCYQQYNVRMGLRHAMGGDPSEWPSDLRVRQFPQVLR